MPDVPKRVYGPAANERNNTLAYTVPANTLAFVRDASITNTTAGAASSIFAIGTALTETNRVLQKSVAANSSFSWRPILVMYPGETLYVYSPAIGTTITGTSLINGGAGAASSFTSASYAVTANKLYVANIQNVKASSPDAVNTLTNTGYSGSATWTLCGTATTGDQTGNDTRSTQYYMMADATDAALTTTVDFAGASQTNIRLQIEEFNDISTSSPFIQYKGTADASVPASNNSGLSASFTSALTGGFVVVHQCNTNVSQTSTPPSNFTEDVDTSSSTVYHRTWTAGSAPGTADPFPANTWSTSTTAVRAASASEFLPASGATSVNFTVNVIEVDGTARNLDSPKRVYGPASPGTSPVTLYTCPSITRIKTFIRDITIVNTGSGALTARLGIGNASTTGNRLQDISIAAGDTQTIRGFAILDDGETLQGYQVEAGSPGLVFTVNAVEVTQS